MARLLNFLFVAYAILYITSDAAHEPPLEDQIIPEGFDPSPSTTELAEVPSARATIPV